MKKLLKIITGVTLSLAMAIGVGVGVASNNKNAEPAYADEESAYIITFSNSANSVSGVSSTTNASTTIASSSRTYVTTQPYTVDSGNVYYGGSSTGEKASIRIGKSGNSAGVSIALSASGQVNATKFVVNCMKMTGDKNSTATLSVNGMDAQSAPAEADNLTFTYASATNITSISLESTKAVFIYSIEVYKYKAGSGGDPEPTPYTVSFNSNGGTGSMDNVSVAAGNYTLPNNGFTAPNGKQFSGWKAGNEGNSIAAGATYNVSADVTFWAQWSDIKYNVTYNANGGTGTMADSSSPYVTGTTVTVLTNTFTRSGYEFVKYNTAANGSGQDYNPGSTFSIGANTTLYAQWSVIKYPCTDENNQITWDLSIASYDTMTDEEATWTSEKATVSIAKSTSLTNVNNVVPPADSHTRFYQNSVMTISPANGYKIDSIVFTAPNNSHANTLNNNTWTNASSSVTSTNVTVIPTIKVEDVVVTFAGATRLTQIIINYSVYSPLSSIALSGTYPTSFEQNDSFSHDGMVVTATYENASTQNVTALAEWSEPNMSTTGSKTVTVTYTEGAITKTASYSITVSAAAYVIPDQPSASGQVGENDILTFTYGNLENSLSVISSATSIVTVGSPDFVSANEGMVQINFVGSGTTTVLFKDGEQQLASVSVTVNRTTYFASNTLLTATLTSGAIVTSGFTITSENTTDKTGYIQDSGTTDTSVCSFVVKSESALFSSEQSAINLVARLGAGSAKNPLGHNVEACFVDADGNEIVGTKVTVATSLPKDPENFTVLIPYSPSAYGVKIMHIKENNWNARYYSFNLSYNYGSTVKTITGTENKTGEVTTSVSSVVMRFGAKFSTDNWTAFNSEHTIADYGVMFAKKATLDANSISSVKSAYETKQSLLFIVRKGSGTAPTPNGGKYVFTSYLSIDSSDYETIFCAAPFIVADGQYYFLDEMRYSVKTLATECQTTHGSPLSSEALAILAGNN